MKKKPRKPVKESAPKEFSLSQLIWEQKNRKEIQK
jgi:hypothetical protein